MSDAPAPERVLTVVYDLDVGGTQRAAQNFAVAYRDLGHDSRVLAIDPTGPRREELERAGIPVLTPDDGLLDAVAAWRPTVVHLHSHGLKEAWVRRLHASAADATWVEQNVFSSPTPWTDLVDCSFQFSEWCQYLYGRHHAEHAPAAIVPNAVDTTSFARDEAAGLGLRRGHRIPADALVLGRVGQALTYKWSPLLVECFEQVAGHEPRAWLLMVGPPDDVRTQAAQSPHSARIVILDHVAGDEGLRAVYSAMDVFAHAARQGESFGYVLAEAMLCEVPVVTLSTPWADNSQCEVVGHEVGGLVATTPAGFTAAAERLLGDPRERARLGSAGRERVIGRYDSRVVAQAALAAADDAKGMIPAVIDRDVLLATYLRAVDPPGALGRLLFRAGRWRTLASLAGVEPWSWLARTTLNRWGIARPARMQRGAR